MAEELTERAQWQCCVDFQLPDYNTVMYMIVLRMCVLITIIHRQLMALVHVQCACQIVSFRHAKVD